MAGQRGGTRLGDGVDRRTDLHLPRPRRGPRAGPVPDVPLRRLPRRPPRRSLRTLGGRGPNRQPIRQDHQPDHHRTARQQPEHTKKRGRETRRVLRRRHPGSPRRLPRRKDRPTTGGGCRVAGHRPVLRTAGRATLESRQRLGPVQTPRRRCRAPADPAARPPPRRRHRQPRRRRRHPSPPGTTRPLNIGPDPRHLPKCVRGTPPRGGRSRRSSNEAPRCRTASRHRGPDHRRRSRRPSGDRPPDPSRRHRRRPTHSRLPGGRSRHPSNHTRTSGCPRVTG